MQFHRLAAVGGVAAFILALLAPGAALAHEHREVGEYEFTVGWFNEPAYVGQKNGIDLRVATLPAGGESHGEAAQSGEQHGGQAEQPQPIEGLHQTLKAEIIQGGQTRQVDLRAVFGQPGRYTADIVPTREGDYRFRFFGTVEGMEVNETFDSADGQFNGVQSIESIQFPEAVPATGQVAETARAAEQRAAAAQSAADASQTMGIVGIAVGTLGLALAAVALVSSGRRARTEQPASARRAGSESS